MSSPLLNLKIEVKQLLNSYSLVNEQSCNYPHVIFPSSLLSLSSHWLSLPVAHLCLHRRAQRAPCFPGGPGGTNRTATDEMKVSSFLSFFLRGELDLKTLSEKTTSLTHRWWVGRTLVQRGIPWLLHQTLLSGGFRIYPSFNRQAHHLSQIKALWMLGGLAFNSCEF